MRNAIVALFGLFILSGCSGPLGPIAGGELEGKPIQWPEDWSYTNDIENVLLQTNPEDPYSVTIWIVVADGVPYIAASDSDARWVRNIQENPEVILSVDGKLINARTSQVVVQNEIYKVAEQYVQKYEMEQEEFVEAEDGIAFRLSPR
ncbi:MAG: hypothetical protein ACFHXK_02005 [bacterium]